MKKVMAMAGASLAVAASTLLGATPAQATDNGNNDATCTYYEICFSEFTDNYQRSHRDFGDDSAHGYDGGGYRFRFKAGSAPTDTYLLDRAKGFWNRDSSCRVSIWDITSGGSWYVAGTYANNAGRWGPLSGQGNASRNNGHTRCNTTTPPDHPFGT